METAVKQENQYSDEERWMFDNFLKTIDSLTKYVENVKMHGSSITESFGEIEIKGINYQIQLRFESDINSFVDADSSYEASDSGIRIPIN